MRLRQQQLAAAAPPIVTNGGWPRLADDIRSMDARQPLVLARLAPQPPPSSNETSKKTEHDIMIERLAAQPQFVAMGNK
jgi:hypothetical protein